MPFDSNGVWSLTAGYLAVTGNTILPLNHNPPLEDIRDNGLSAVLVRDGRAPMTGPLNMNTNKITNLATGTAGTDAATVAQVPSLSGILAGFRNKIINGDFFIWQRANSQTATGYGSDDRWSNGNVGTTKTHSQQVHTFGQTSVPGNPYYYSRTAVTSVAGASNCCFKLQAMESVFQLGGLDVTVTFWAKADASKNMSVSFEQYFGTGGSPSADVVGIGAQLIPLTTAWTKVSKKITLPSIAGKTLGTNGDHATRLFFWFDAGSSLNTRTASLGQQSGTFDISHVSVVVGDATSEADPFSPRHVQQELALCQRYFRPLASGWNSYGLTGNNVGGRVSISPPMRAVPTSNGSSAGNSNAGATTIDTITSTSFRAYAAVVASGSYEINILTNLDAEL